MTSTNNLSEQSSLFLQEKGLNIYIYYDEIIINGKKLSLLEAIKLVKNEENKKILTSYFGISKNSSTSSFMVMTNCSFFFFFSMQII